MTTPITRRALLSAAAALSGCGVLDARPPTAKLPDQIPSQPVKPIGDSLDSVDALFETLLPGARAVGVDRVLEVEHFVRLAVAQGFLMPLSEDTLLALDDLAGAGRQTLNRALDVRAQLERPNARFAELSSEAQQRIVTRAFDDEATRPLMLAARAACFYAYLGAVSSDTGLRELGFPAFENFDDGLAVSGYPRMTDGSLDDYTFNRAPAVTVGDDVSLVLLPDGNLR